MQLRSEELAHVKNLTETLTEQVNELEQTCLHLQEELHKTLRGKYLRWRTQR